MISPLASSILVLFLPACACLLWQAITAAAVSTQVLALAILLLCGDQARAAFQDLYRVRLAQQIKPQPQLQRFYWVTIGTIVVELVGFYGTVLSLGWGAILVMISQIGFHCTAVIRLDLVSSKRSDSDVVIVPWGIESRWLILVANAIGIALVVLWLKDVAALGVAISLLAMVLAYGMLKYLTPIQ